MGGGRTAACVSLVALALVVVGLLAGCSSDPPPPRWQEVASGSFDGTRTQQLDLGTLYLTGRVRLAWDLSGPSDARSEFTLEAVRETDATSSSGVGSSRRSWKGYFALRSDRALEVTVEPDYYRVTLTQQLSPPDGAGYSGTFTLYTQDL
jgi:hypothetical protein